MPFVCSGCRVGILCSSSVDEHHKDVSGHHAFLLSMQSLMEFFSQAIHEALKCIVIILLVMRVAARNASSCIFMLSTVNGGEAVNTDAMVDTSLGFLCR